MPSGNRRDDETESTERTTQTELPESIDESQLAALFLGAAASEEVRRYLLRDEEMDTDARDGPEGERGTLGRAAKVATVVAASLGLASFVFDALGVTGVVRVAAILTDAGESILKVVGREGRVRLLLAAVSMVALWVPFWVLQRR